MLLNNKNLPLIGKAGNLYRFMQYETIACALYRGMTKQRIFSFDMFMGLLESPWRPVLDRFGDLFCRDGYVIRF